MVFRLFVIWDDHYRALFVVLATSEVTMLMVCKLYSYLFFLLDASLGIIKKKYHELSLIYHPDMKTGDNDKFITISKAYKTLTDPNLLKNYYDTGDPNGRRTLIFNIALPSILSDDQYSTWILLVYGLCFLILFPTGVLFWWYRSIKYGNTQVFRKILKSRKFASFVSKCSGDKVLPLFQLPSYTCCINVSTLLLLYELFISIFTPLKQ